LLGRKNVQTDDFVDHVAYFQALFLKLDLKKTSINVHDNALETRRACACRKEAEDNKKS
jgi:hypothetical protein